MPEVEVLVRHLRPLLIGQTIEGVKVFRAKVVRPTTPLQLTRTLRGSRFVQVERRGKYLVFSLRRRAADNQEAPLALLGHLGMTGRMYLLPAHARHPRPLAVCLKLGAHDLIFEDTRYFGRLTLDLSPLTHLGPEPLTTAFTAEYLASALARSAQAIKVKLLDQSLVTGLGNIYASEALFRARISPRRAARRLSRREIRRLWQAVREVLAEAIAWGSTVPLNWSGQGPRDGLFYYGRAPNAPANYVERLAVYDRAGKPCLVCGQAIRRLAQAGRSTFYCPRCQRGAGRERSAP